MRSEDILGYFIIGFILSTSYYVYRENYESFQLTCIVSTVDGNKYCVRERENIEKAADLFSEIEKRNLIQLKSLFPKLRFNENINK